MRLLKMAARFYAGYKLKAVSLFIFMTICLTIIMGALDLLYNSFNIWYGKNATYILPRFFVSQMADFSILRSNYGIANIVIDKAKRDKLENELKDDFDFYEVAYFWCQMYSKRYEWKRPYVFIVGMDFAELGKAYSYFDGRFDKDRVADYQAKPKLIVDARLAKNWSIAPGEEFVLLTTNYFKDINGIRVSVRDVMTTPLTNDNAMGVPLVYIDKKNLTKLFAIPADKALPFILVPQKEAPVFSIRNALLRNKIEAAAKPLGLHTFSASDVSMDIYSTFLLYQGIFLFLGAVLVLLMIASISSNLFINFQNRKADFGVMKAFGCGNGRFFRLILLENALGIALPLVLAVAINYALGEFIGNFTVMGYFVVTLRVSPIALVSVIAISIGICFTSLVQPFRYLRRIDPVEILREE
jgi:ABC-type lipoprotein release transport system permease subunit